MASTNNSGLGTGTSGNPQTALQEQNYSQKVSENEQSTTARMIYAPSPKHDKGGWGSRNPIKSNEEGQKLLETGYKSGKQVYNVTDDGTFIKFQPDNANGYHAYEIDGSPDIPSNVLERMYKDGKISKPRYNKARKGKK